MSKTPESKTFKTKQLESEALDNNTSAERLRELADYHSKLIRQAVAQNPNTPPDILLKLFDQFPFQVLSNSILNLLLIENPLFLEKLYFSSKSIFDKKLPLFFIEWAMNHPNKTIRADVAYGSQVSQQYLEKLAKDREYIVRLQVAANNNASIYLLNQLGEDENHYVRETVAKHPQASLSILEKLAQDEVAEVRRQVAKNYNTPNYILKYLARDNNLHVRADAIYKIDD
ncbi:MAG: HEAT repeat domain-containing protein [Cyanobacteria bacterium P01_A01_bin.45]